MIRGYVLGFSKPDKAVSYGDAELFRSGSYNLLIDGYCGSGADKLISYLKKRKIKNLYLALTHAHYDHYDGLRKIIRDSYFTVKGFYCYDPSTLEVGLTNNKGSEEARKDMNNMKNVLKEVKNKGIKITYVDHGDTIKLGGIKINVYRKQPTKVQDDDVNAYSYVNDGSLCFYFPELYYWTSGDGSERMGDFIKELGLKVRYFKIAHHGNSCTKLQANYLKQQGANVCWYNYLEPNGIGTTDFTEFGTKRCKEAGITVLNAIGDINWIAYGGKMYIYHYGKSITNFTCPYNGKSTLKNATVDIIRNIFEGKFGNSDNRVTNLIDAGYYYGSAQAKVTKVVTVAQNIINGKVNYGKNAERIVNLDKAFGTGYGQLIQDEINSLLKSKSAKW